MWLLLITVVIAGIIVFEALPLWVEVAALVVEGISVNVSIITAECQTTCLEYCIQDTSECFQVGIQVL
ncbi:MAG: hypothetical protein H8D34_15825 [Chloroflexi bacterium]|nr:hypothetical protein [Chloroflexota bacterium]